MKDGSRATLAVVLVPLAVVSWGLAVPKAQQERAGEPPDMRQLWVDPGRERDLFHGPGGAKLAPRREARYEIIAIKVGGFSDGYDVRDPEGREWSVKLPPEASTEVVSSRLIWGLGYHQPPVYFLPEWHADNPIAPNPQLPARFRENEPDFHGLDREGDWSFADNPFVGTTQLQGLLVLQAMLGNSDLKPSNNSLYSLETPVEGVDRWYVVRDVGHSFGRSGTFDSPRGDPDAFEASDFILGVMDGRVALDYRGRHAQLFADISVEDVRWICERLDALTDRQWADAFRAGGFEPGIAGRFIRKMKLKVEEGLSLSNESGAGSNARPER